MFAPANLVIILLFLGFILTYAILFFRQQRKLSEIKARLLIGRKEIEQLKQRKDIVTAEMARVKPEFKKKLWETKLLRIELGELRDDIREDIQNIRKESDGLSGEGSGSLSRVAERRKKMLKEKLGDYSSHKSICIDRQMVVDAAGNAIKTLSLELDENISRLESLAGKVKKLEQEFNTISKSPVLKLPIKRREKNPSP